MPIKVVGATRVSLTVTLGQIEHNKLAKLAREKGETPAGLAARFIERALLLASSDDRNPERELLDWVEAYLAPIRASGEWDSDVTLRVFQAIEQDQLPLYEEAIVGGQQTRINRQVGALIRRKLAAITRSEKNRLLVRYPKLAESRLIRSYTMLFRDDRG